MSNDRGTHAVWHSAAFAVVALTPALGLANLNLAATYRFAQNLFDVTTQGLESELAYQHQFMP